MLLFIDTTQDKSQVALIKDRRILDHRIFKAYIAHSEKLLPEVERLLKNGGVKLGDLEAIVVMTGPGAFTGVRVGVAVSNALAFALDVPIAGVSKNEIEEEDFFSEKTILKITLLGEKKLKAGEEKTITPYYEKPPHITRPKPIY